VASLLLLSPASAQTTRKEVLAALEQLPHPGQAEDFHEAPHLAGLNQGNSSVCWSYATSSFVESEMARLHRPSVRLSVMYPVYCEFLEKTRRYVRMKGDSRFDPGDLFTGVTEACQLYGALPASAYDTQTPAHLPDHSRLYTDLRKLMQELKRNDQWDESLALSNVTRILNQRLGEPPGTFSFNGQSYTPQAFRDDVVGLPWSDYVLITSFETGPFNAFTEFKVPDNWHHNTNYLNVPLPAFYDAFKQAIRSGYSVAVSMDNSEPSYRFTGRYCFIPAGDLPASGITQALREQQFQGGATTDDHAIHILGYRQVGGEDWFVAKDSCNTTWRDYNQGRLFLHSSYVKLKVLAFMVHRDAVRSLVAGLPHS
jgi:bleomycin hydrolase